MMKIYLLDINKNMTDAWQKYFDPFKEENIEIINEDFITFMDKHPNIEAIVSPANSFGLMDGGYDKAITDYFGERIKKDVQEAIMIKWYGEQPVGTSMTVPITNRIITDKKCEKHGFVSKKYAILIHTPSMRTPEQITDNRIIYQCMRTTLIEAIRQEVDSIVIPAFGGLTGKVPFDIIAKMMFFAYKQIYNQPNEINWGYALHIANELKRYNLMSKNGGNMANKYTDYEEKLRPCCCGGKVMLNGGTYGYPTFEIQCSRCGGRWNMHTYSPVEAVEKWGVKFK